MTTRRRRAAEPQVTPEGWPIVHAWWGRAFWHPERRAWYPVETPAELAAKIETRQREQRAPRTTYDPHWLVL